MEKPTTKCARPKRSGRPAVFRPICTASLSAPVEIVSIELKVVTAVVAAARSMLSVSASAPIAKAGPVVMPTARVKVESSMAMVSLPSPVFMLVAPDNGVTLRGAGAVVATRLIASM